MVDSRKYYIECGVELKAVKDSLAHGQWLPWLKVNEEVLGFREKTEPRLIKVAESNFSPARHLDDSEALAISRQI